MGVIRIDGVSFSYEDALDARKNADDQVQADYVLDNVCLEVPDGQFLCLIGHSGCGKSTLLRLLLGLSQPTKGAIYVDDRKVDGPDLDRSIVFQNYSLFPWMKARQNVEFGVEQASKLLGRGLTKEQIRQRADEYLAKVDMADAADKYPYQLSGGMQQRVAIARALAMDTDILFFDEPFGALDVRTRRSLQQLVDELWRSGSRRKTVVFVTHDISEAILLADRVVFMGHGRVLEDIDVDIPRPRNREELRRNPRAEALRARLTDLFYQDGPADDLDQADAELFDSEDER
ncbi:MAG: ABC transporter ATP-binding protein [Coriobacteriia bacterium]|nr:ABC transporter ATP-binding protein [Coriobacteriia bacterium]